MSTELEELVIRLSANTESLQAEMKAATTASQQAAYKMSKAVNDLAASNKKDVSSLQKIWETAAGFVGGQAVVGAVKMLANAFVDLGKAMIVDGVKAAQEEQDALNQLNQTMARSGIYSKAAASAMAEFAEATSKSTKFSSEAVLGVSSMIQNVNRLNSPEALQGATKATLDFAAGMNITAETASRVVANAINGNVGALAKYGIAVEEGATKTETLNNVMQVLGQRFGGAAAAAAQTFSGNLQKIGENSSDVSKEIGFAIIQNEAVVGVMSEVNLILQEMIKWLSENQQTVREWIAEGVLYATAALDGLVVSLKAVTDLFGGSDVVDGMAEATGRLVDRAGEGAAKVALGMTAAEPAVINVVTAFDRMSEKMQEIATNGQTMANSLVAASKDVEGQYSSELESLQLRNQASLISDADYFAAREEMLLTKYATEQEMLAAALQGQLITREEFEMANTELAKKTADAQLKIQMDRVASEAEINKKREENFKSTLSNIATLQSSGSKTLGAIGKAAAISQATIDGYAAVQKALASAPPPFNFVLAGLVGAATAANVGKIASTPLRTGIDSVPGVGTQDNFPAMLAPGERVVPSRTNQDLTKFLQGEGANQAPNVNVYLTVQGDILSDPDSGIRMVEKINDAIRRGLTQLVTT